jgi:predicted transcriptional regulator YdeE
MPQINIIKRKQINAPLDKVYQTINRMSTWKRWSPWLIMDPDAKVDVSTDDKSYSWSGKSTGEGWMKNKMVSFIGNDYERGLNLLKDFVEDGQIHSKLDWKGESQYPGCTYLGIRRTCSIADMPKLMEEDFTQLISYAMSYDTSNTAGAFNQYHKFDFVKGIVDYTAGVPFENIPANAHKEYITGNLPATKLYTLEHKGPYHHIGNAWSTMYNMHQNKEIKIKKGYAPFETYGNSPKNTDPKELISYINFAVK